MRREYPEQYIRTKLGDGYVRILDNGQTYYERHGRLQANCKRCESLVDERDLEDGLCPECQEYDRECQRCGESFSEALELDKEGFPICQQCIELEEKLEQIIKVEVESIDLAQIARQVLGIKEAV